MTKQTDWIKIIAIILAILFFMLWVINVSKNIGCEDTINELHSQWQYAYNTLNNCYKNSIPSCTVDIPILK